MELIRSEILDCEIFYLKIQIFQIGRLVMIRHPIRIRGQRLRQLLRAIIKRSQDNRN